MAIARLRTKIILSFCGLMIAGGTLTTLMVRYTLRQSLTEATGQHGHVVSEIMADQLVVPLMARDWQKVQLLVNAESDHNAYVFVETADGRVVSSTAGRSSGSDVGPALRRTEPSVVEVGSEAVLDVPTKIAGGKVGVVHVGVSLQPVSVTTRRVLGQLLWTTLAAMLVGVVGIFLLSGVMTRPVTALASAARRMAEGDLGARAPIVGGDELAEFGKTFNDMAGELESRVATSEALRTYFERILDHLTKAVFVISQDRRVEYANRNARESFDVRAGEEAPTFLGSALDKALRASSSAEIHRRTRLLLDGRTVAMALAQIQTEHSTRAVVVSVADVTEMQRMSERLLRTERIAVAGEISAGIVHAINNPLDAVRRALELARRHRDDEERMEQLLSYVQEGVDRIAGVTANLLSFARADATESAREVDVTEVLAAAVQLVSLRAEEAGIGINEHCEPGKYRVRVDPRAMVDVVVNIVANAVDASPTGGMVEIRAGKAAGGGVEIRVTDEGEGIPEEVQSRVFEPFFTTKEPGRGTGLGLSMARRITDAFGGEITVSSAVGAGTTFTVKLPAAQAEAHSVTT